MTNSSKTIFFLLPEFKNGGAELQAYLAACRISRIHRVVFISIKNSIYPASPRFRLLSLGAGNKNIFLWIKAYINLIFLYIKYRPQYTFAYLHFSCFFASLPSFFFNSNLIYNIRESSILTGSIATPFFSFSHFFSSAIFSNSIDACKAFSTISNKPVIHTPNLINTKPIYSIIEKKVLLVDSIESKPDYLRIIYPARFVEKKNHALIINTILNSSSLRNSVKVTFVGQDGGYLRHLQSLCTTSNSFNFIPYTNIESIFQLYICNDILCFPSLWHEGQSNVLLEAAMMNMNILCASIHKNQLPNLMYSVYFFDVNVPSSLNRALSYLLSIYKRLPLRDRFKAIEENLKLAENINRESFCPFIHFIDR